MKRNKMRAGLVVLAGVISSCAMPAWAEQVAVVGATIIDATGKPPIPNGTVLISDGLITAVDRSAKVKIPKGAKRVDARGKFLIPGLMEGINQPLIPGDPETLIRYDGRYDQLNIEAAQVALKHGLTTVVAAFMYEPTVKARDMIAAGKVPGARILVRGTHVGLIQGPGCSGDADPRMSKDLVERLCKDMNPLPNGMLAWMSPEQMRPVIREWLRTHDVDFVKYASAANTPLVPLLHFSPNLQKVIVEEAHRAGLPVFVHTFSTESADMAIEAGADVLAHGTQTGPIPYTPELIRKIVDRGIYVGAFAVTRRNMEARAELSRRTGKSPITKSPEDIETSMLNLRNMIKAGVKLVMGTESVLRPFGWRPDPNVSTELVESSWQSTLGEAHVYSMMGLEQNGMAPMEILRTATINVAHAYKLDAKLGTVEPGKIADLVILDADPLKDARNYGRVSGVIKDGRVVDIKALPVTPLLTAAPASAR